MNTSREKNSETYSKEPIVKKQVKIPETEIYLWKPTICSISSAQDSIFPTTHLQKLCPEMAAIDNRRELQQTAEQIGPTAAITLLLEIVRGEKKSAPSSYIFSIESLPLP